MVYPSRLAVNRAIPSLATFYCRHDKVKREAERSIRGAVLGLRIRFPHLHIVLEGEEEEDHKHEGHRCGE